MLAQAMLTTMCQQLFQLYSQCIDASKNLARYYAHSIQPTLFGQTSLMRCWGRIGRRGQEKVHRFFDEQQPVSLFFEIARQKRSRGYKPVGNCGDLAILAAPQPGVQ